MLLACERCGEDHPLVELTDMIICDHCLETGTEKVKQSPYTEIEIAQNINVAESCADNDRMGECLAYAVLAIAKMKFNSYQEKTK